MRHLRVLLAIGTAIPLVWAAPPALAQDGAAAATSPSSQTAGPQDALSTANEQDETNQLADIIVTGRKRARSEALQEVPLSITALGEAQLSQPVVVNLVDIGRLTPNASLQPSSQRGIQNFAIRGMGISGSTPSDEPAVGVFQDGVYWGSNYGALADLFDLEGVEILRGPQGTLFGRNVTGGAITVRSARPGRTPYSKVSIGVGNGDLFEASGVVNAPVGDGERLSSRLAVQARTGGDLFYDTNARQSYGGTSSYLIRPSLRWTPSETFDVTVLGEYYNEYGSPTVVRGISPRQLTANPPTLAEREGFRTPDDYFDVFPNDRGFSDIEVFFGMLEFNWEIGPGVLTSVTGYRQVKARVRTDFDGTPSRGFLQGILNDQDQISSELRYAANVADWLGFTAGLYYFKQDFDFRENRRLNNDQIILATRSLLDNESYAAFAEADITPFDRFTITAGGRYTRETKDARAAPFGACSFDFTTCNFGTERNYEEDNFSPKVGISYQASEDALLFASVTRGFRSGGFSLRGTALVEPYVAETTTAYEAGFKTDFFDNRVRFNAAAYYNEYKDLQRTVLGVSPTQGVVQAVFNAADANIKGAEVELITIPFPGFTLSGNYGYTDASYESFLGVTNPEDREFVRVPKHTFNVSADYLARLNNGDAINARVTASHTGRYFYDDPNLLVQRAYTLVDATLAYTLESKMTIAAYAKNIFNEEYANWGSTLGALGENLFPGNPRTYGLRLSAEF